MSFEFKDEFFEKLKKVNKPLFLRNMTSHAGTIAVNFSKERFRNKNWVDRTREKWPNRKRKSRGTLLSKSGRLKRSIRKLAHGNYYVFIGTDVPYAQIHNEGGEIKKTVSVRAHSRSRAVTRGNGRARKPKKPTGKVKAHTRKMNLTIAKRQFLGNSAVLTRRIERHMYKQIEKELK